MKCDIYLYFKTYEELKIALKYDLFLRKFFTDKLKDSPSIIWLDEKKLSEYEKKLLDDLKKVNNRVNPAELEIEPILLKV